MSRKPFSERIVIAAVEKKSPIVLALDPCSSNKQSLLEFAEKMIRTVEQYVCAIKINFHILLPLSEYKISRINKLAHSFGLQSIADIKLNDIENTNIIAVDLLAKMGFDAVIANPFIGENALASLVQNAHNAGVGIIALVYMSHPGAKEGFGLEMGGHGLYKTFLGRARVAAADGVVVGATQLDILQEVAGGLPVYSPGVGAQGGSAEKAIRSGADYLIIGRSIIEAKQPNKVAERIQKRILSISE
ncbi:MAG: orotidine 5'-phosphate decarboxylase [Thermoproteota archaeon]|jgi:orotidine-5'-phosphate decarboxylase|nr:orotidine 5'-phosphate decarboxylase [Thermoproteota archaeon]